MLRSCLAAAVAAVCLVVPAPVRADAPGTGSAPLGVTGFAYGGLPLASLRRDAHALETVTVDGVGLRPSGRSVTTPGRDDLRLVRSAGALGLRTELLVHNWSERRGGFDPRRAHRLLSDPAAVRSVARRLAALAVAGGWDGVNVDLELVARRDAAGLVALCAALQRALPAAATVTVDVSASTTLRGYAERGYDLAGLAGVVDRVELMTYDQHGPGWSAPGPVGALGWQRRAARTVLRVVPAAQVDLGVAGYGYTWARGGRGWTVTPATARRLARQAGVRPVWHATAGEWSARLPGGRVMWWQDARSYRERERLARTLGVHGLALWRLGSADPLP